MQSHKNLVQEWQKTSQHSPPQTNSEDGGKLTENYETTVIPCSPTSKNYEKLRRKMWEMKHRVCLLEFGLGSVAKLMQDLNEFRGPQGAGGGDDVAPIQYNEGTHLQITGASAKDESGNGSYKKILKGIGDVLQDIESSIKSATNCCPAKMANQATLVSAPPVAHEAVPLQSDITSHLGKTRIFIDETKPGENSLTMTPTSDLYTIQVMENPGVMFPPSSMRFSSSQQQHTYTTITGNMASLNRNEHYTFVTDPVIQPLSSFEALSTLASVASSKHAEEMINRGKMNEICMTGNIADNVEKMEGKLCTMTVTDEKTRGQQLLNPFMFTEEEDIDNVPLKKRQRISMTVDSPEAVYINGRGKGVNTRRKRRKQRYHQL